MWLTCWISSISSRKDEIVVQIANPGLKRWRADHLPAMAPADLVVDLEGDLTAQHVGDLVALVVKMEHRLRAGWRGFLERYHALAGFAAQQLERGRAAGRHAQDRPAAGRHHKAFCIHREDSFRCFH